MITKQTDVDGVEHIHRNENEPPIAQLTAPKLMPGNGWGIRYRNGNEEPFHGEFNVTKPTRKDALRDVKEIIKVCNEEQLGLA